MSFFALLARLLLITTAAPPAGPDGLLNEAVMRRVSDATVFIRIDLGDDHIQSGSGFLTRRQGKAGYIITNNHVVEVAADGKHKIETVFFSGLRHEKVYEATILARDPDMDLAILKIEAPALPMPLTATRPPAIEATSPVFIFGFPFGVELKTSKGSPAIAISPALVSSLRRDDSGEVRIVQLQGDLNPGNSGGPIVDPNGGLVGVAVAKIEGTLIGFAVAPGGINEMFLGGPRAIILKSTESGADWVKLRAEVEVNNPMDTIASVSILLLPKEKMPELPASGKLVGRAPAFKQMTEHPLKIDGSVASADIKLDKDRASDGVYWLQVKCVRKNRQTMYFDPKIMDVNKARGIKVVEGTSEASASASGSDSKSGANTKPGAEAKAKAATKPAPERADSGKGWLGGPPGQPMSLIGEVKKVLGATVTQINLNPETGSGLQAEWSKDGKFVFVFSYGSKTETWTLRKIAVPEFKEVATATIEGRGGVEFSMSKAGIVLFTRGELSLFSPGTLKLIRRIEVPDCDVIATCPNLDVAFCSGRSYMELFAIDLEKATSSTIRASDVRPTTSRKGPAVATLHQFDSKMDITPDGKYLITTGMKMNRFRINGKGLVHEETSEYPVAHPGSSVDFTPDSKFINATVQAHPGEKPTVTPGRYLIPVNDFLNPTKPSPTPSGTVVDPVSGNLYSCPGALLVFSGDGTPQRSYDVGVGSSPFRRGLLVHPSGNKVLVCGGQKSVWVELPANGPVLSDSVPTPEAGGEDLKVKTIDKQGLKYQTTALSSHWEQGIVLSRDGEAVFVLRSDGVLQKILLPAFKAQCQLRIEGTSRNLCLSAEGLLVHVESLQELWVISEADLHVIRRFPWYPKNRVMSSPGLSAAIGAGKDEFGGILTIQGLRAAGPAVTLKIEQIQTAKTAVLPPDSFAHRPSFETAEISPDGKYMIAVTDGFVFRYAIKGSTLECEEVGRAEQIRNEALKVFSSDSMYFAVGNTIFKLNDLRAPVLQTSEQSNYLAFDPKSGKLYQTGYRDNKLSVVGPDGKPEKEFENPVVGRILVHPQGYKLVLVSGSQMIGAVDLSDTSK